MSQLAPTSSSADLSCSHPRSSSSLCAPSHLQRFVRWVSGLASLVCLSELLEWGWTNTRFSSQDAAMSSLTIASSIVLLGPAMAMWLGSGGVRKAWLPASPGRLTVMSWVGQAAMVAGYACLLGALMLGDALPEVLPLSAMLVLLSCGTLAMSWQGKVGPLRDGPVAFGLFVLIVPISYAVALRLTSNVWRPSIIMIMLVVSASLAAATMAALRWPRLDMAARLIASQAAMDGLLEDLEVMRRSRDLAEQRLDQRTKFLARLSHELRTPLTTMVGFSQLIDLDAHEPLSAKQRHKLSYVIKSGALLQRLVDDMSNLSDVDKGDLTIRREEVGLQDVLDTVTGMMMPVARRHGVTLQLPKVPMGSRVLGDEQRLIQILLNLVGNAIKYNRQGGSVWITVEEPYHLLVEISVNDSGHGIDASQMSRLFEPFNRLGRETSDIPGLGLGLAHCKLLASLMDGHIDAASQSGEGTQMTLTLPAAPSRAEETPLAQQIAA